MRQNKKRIFSLIFTITMLLGLLQNITLATVFAEESLQQDGVYQIGTIDNLIISPQAITLTDDAPSVNAAIGSDNTLNYSPINVVINVQHDNGGFIIARQEYSVTPGLAESYGYDNDSEYIGKNEVSALDALVAAHIWLFGDDIDGINNNLVLSDYGWGSFITKVFGIDTSNFTCYVNGEQPNDGIAALIPGYGTQYTGYGYSQAKLNEGDVVEFFFIQDDMWMDNYVWFESDGVKTEAISVTAGENFDVAVKGYMGWKALNIPEERNIEPIEDAAVVLVDLDGGAGIFTDVLAVTDEDGIVSLSFDEPGTYIISAIDDSGYAPLMSPWLAVTVKESIEPPEQDESVLAAIALIDAIPDPLTVITLSNEQIVLSAKAAFDALTSEQQSQIEQVKQTKLADAVQRISDLKAAAIVTDIITALPSPTEIQLSDKNAAQSVRSRYNALTAAQKALIAQDVLEKLISVEAAISTLEGLSAVLPTTEEIKTILAKTFGYKFITITNPSIGSEWTVLGLARDGSITDVFKETYLVNLKDYLHTNSGVLAAPGGNYTEYSRVILALTALGEDPSDIAGYNLFARLAEFENVKAQGLNSIAYALIALDSKNYEIPLLPAFSSYTNTTRDMLIAQLLSVQLKDGGWAISPSMPNSTIDYTTMAIQALAPYYGKISDVTAALDRAIIRLSQLQMDTAGYGSSENDAQVIVSLNALDISLDDEAFIKNGKTIYDDLLSFYNVTTGAFSHTVGTADNAVSTEQAMYALVSLYRAITGVNTLYDMTDVIDPVTPITDAEAVNIAAGSLSWDIIKGSNITQNSVTSVLNLPLSGGNGVTISWSSNNSHISNTGAVIRPSFTEGDQKVTLTAALSRGSEVQTVTFTLIVKAISQGVTNDYISIDFRLVGDSKHDRPGNHSRYIDWIPMTTLTFDNVTQVSIYEVFMEAIDKYGFSQYGAQNNYVQEINGLSELDNGPNSGWMFMVNGKHTDVGLQDYFVGNGDIVVWHYSDDHNREQSSWERTFPNGTPEGLGSGSGSGYGGTGGSGSGGDFTYDQTNNTDGQINETDDGSQTVITSTDTNIRQGLLGIITVGMPATFTDVPAGHWGSEYIDYVSARGIMSGIGNNSFEPERAVTRAEFVTILFMLSGNELPGGMTRFIDVPATEWYAPYVAWALENGIVFGTSESAFSPEAKITRQDMSVILKRFIDFKGVTLGTVNQAGAFTDDKQISGYAKDAVYYMQQAGVISGIGNGKFAPADSASRAQAAVMIAKILMSLGY